MADLIFQKQDEKNPEKIIEYSYSMPFYDIFNKNSSNHIFRLKMIYGRLLEEFNEINNKEENKEKKEFRLAISNYFFDTAKELEDIIVENKLNFILEKKVIEREREFLYCNE